MARFLPGMKSRSNIVADALSRAPVNNTTQGNLSVVLVVTEGTADPVLKFFGEWKVLDEANKVINQAKKGYHVVDGVLYYEGADMLDRRRLVVPSHLQQRVIEEHHKSRFAGHCATK